MLNDFNVVYVGGIYDVSDSVDIKLEDKESTICGYLGWCLLHHRADSIRLYRYENGAKKLVAIAERKVLVTMKVPYAADITKLI